MSDAIRIERALNAAVESVEFPECPPNLAAAIRYAVFPGGARIRPRLCLAVAAACGDDQPAVTDAAAAAIELMHCASLVHDDLPCFDDADMRRSKLTVHREFGERLAVLSGDALIVLAFQSLARVAAVVPERLPRLIQVVGTAVGAPCGITAGQAWECEQTVPLVEYQRAKTGALFAAATELGAIAAGMAAEPWRALGEYLGEAYQVADDIRDATGDPEKLGKPVGRDVALDRPSATRELGLEGAVQRLKGLVKVAIESIPECPGAEELRAHIIAESNGLLPKELDKQAV